MGLQSGLTAEMIVAFGCVRKKDHLLEDSSADCQIDLKQGNLCL